MLQLRQHPAAYRDAHRGRSATTGDGRRKHLQRKRPCRTDPPCGSDRADDPQLRARLLHVITGLGFITGIIAIVFAAQVNGKINSGDYAGAVEASKVARILNWVSLGILAVGVLIIAILVIFTILVLVGAAASA